MSDPITFTVAFADPVIHSFEVGYVGPAGADGVGSTAPEIEAALDEYYGVDDWRTYLISGEGTPQAGEDDIQGSHYFNTDDGTLYIRGATIWELVYTFGGGGGTETTWRTGTVSPGNEIGIDGDWYANTVTGTVDQKVAGTYVGRGNILGATAASVAAGYQPLDSDLTAIAALSTVTFGRSVLTWADAAAGRTALGLGTLATQSGTFSGTSSGTNTGDQDLSSYATTASVAAGYQPLDSDLTAIAALSTVTFGRSALTWADAAAGRTALGLGSLATQSGTFSGTSSGTNTGDQDLSSYATTAAVAAGYQPLDSDLTAIAALSTVTFGRSALTWADAAAGRTALGLVIGTNVQAYDADLTTWAGVTPGTGVAAALATTSIPAVNAAAFYQLAGTF